MKNDHKIKLIAASLMLAASFGATAGLGGLNVQSHLGEPFSGTITVTGDEAKTLLNGGKASVSNSNLRVGVRKSGDKAVVTVRSSKPVQDPILIFQVGVGSQSREYTAIIDPAGYNGKTDGATRVAAERHAADSAGQDNDRRAARGRINRALRAEREEQSARRTGQVRKSDVRSDKKASKPVVKNAIQPKRPAANTGRHLVRSGETVSGIARHIRPQGLTVEQTIQALVNANPTVFIDNDADRMLAGKVLNIPSAAELKRLAGQPLPERSAEEAGESTVATPPVVASDVQPAPAATVETENTAAQTVPAQQEQASAAASSAAAGVAAETAASAAEAPASETAVAASEPDTAVSSAAATAQPEPQPAQEEGGLWKWLLLGGAALLALYLISKLLGKRSGGTPDDAAVAAESVDVAKAAPVATETDRAKAAASDEELAVEDDFSDDIFFTEVDSTPAAKKDSVNLDLSTLDNQQSGILSGAVTRDEETEKRRDIDWDTVESTESVYEPDPETPFAAATVAQGAKQDVVTAEPVVETFSAAEPVTKTATKAQEQEAWDFFADTAETAANTTDKPADQTTSSRPVADDKPLEFTAPQSDNLAEADKKVILESDEAVANPFDIQPDETLVVQDNEDLAASANQVETATADEFIKWEEISVADDAEKSRRESGFISESVGMTAPLEAKYELAKMYVEIGDPEAARETLQELLEEAHGSILTKAKAMLKELDA
ncbi:FimV/HubP family polar landmark protein [Neisseria perflava]|uniref:FimV/HubP family polar landmark protein n=1 Tax=Neisseria perflava TaxID=33053 RepID=UPI00209D4687|nr:FimV/HubP family polar landmark protein [Neisseria perflava]MCP1659936.1 pilus assembly protein FimV [Neisseria perflava]